MEINFSKEELINHCLNEVFKKNCIKHLRCRKDWSISSQEIVFDINGKNINISRAHQEQSEIRFNFVKDLIYRTINYYNLNLNCQIIVATHDTVQQGEKYTRLCFSCSFDSNHLQIPDPHIFYHIFSLNEHLKNDTSFETKKDKIHFCGSDTGALYEDLLNQRIKFCNKAYGNANVTAKITNFVSFKKEMLQDLGVDIDKIKGEYIPINKQLENKYILNIDGNAASWDRTGWGMASNCYLIHLKSELCNLVNWYYPYIQKNNILPICSEEDILSFNIKYNPEIKEKQKKFASLILDPNTHFEYLKELLIRYNEAYNGN
jgi:hypothetical protein